MRRRSTFLVIALSAGLSLLSPAEGQALPRAASVSVCADQFLLMLADKAQITSLSWQVDSPISFYAEEAKGLPQNKGSAEELLLQDAELVVMNQGSGTALKAALRRFGVEVFELPLSTRFEEVEETVLKLSAALGRPGRGKALVAEMRARLAAVKSAVREKGPLTLYYRAGGGGAGADTFVHAVMEAAGLRNMQAEIGHQGWRSLPLEHAVLDPPQAFVTSFFDSPFASVRSAFRFNPVFRELAEGRPLYEVPGKFWPCSSPLLVDAAETLAAQRRKETGS
ncbi:ABC transporter substrate-binding protein [Tepidicaulis sp. LMO-SS28]|uniref:ABC transporter substrate-binding protein n=1 Tax=Tepidicaulis sp. LMO-SS28 TaxID=3447455 RepID=UPI003EE1AEB2